MKSVFEVMKLLLSIFLLCLCATLSAQNLLQGRITNKENGEPVPFVNIGVLNTSVGTSALENGTFQISIPDHLMEGKLTFSAVGFERFQTEIESIDMSEPLKVELTQSTRQLADVVVSRRGLQQGTWGRKKDGPGKRGINIFSENGGSAIATYVRLEEEPLIIDEIKLFISENELDNFQVRCRLLEVTQDGIPGNDLLLENVIVESSIKSGWLIFQLADLDIFLPKEFFLSFEWIMTEEARKAYSRFIMNRNKKLSWLPANGTIQNGKMIYLNASDKRVRKPLSPEQHMQVNQEDYPKTLFAIRKPKKNTRTFVKTSSMDAWRPLDELLVAYIQFRY